MKLKSLSTIALFTAFLVAAPHTGLAQQAPNPADKPAVSPAPNKPTRITTDHLEIATSVTDAVLEPGSKVTLAIDVTPRERVHVYAPGNENYIPITVQIDAQPALTVPPPEYPPAEDFFFAPLNEHVKVYQKSFRIVQHITLGTSQEVQDTLKKQPSLTIKGIVRYQACDDRVCFAPTKVPVSWTVTRRATGSGL